MNPVVIVSRNHISKINIFSNILPVCTQVRWRKPFRRKPRYLPMAQSKVFRIPKHPYVPPEEKQLAEDLHDEYYRKIDSLRKMFQDEIQRTTVKEKDAIYEQQREEQFKLLLEENKKENERIKIIREETLEREFQEKQLQMLQMAEEKKLEMEKTKQKVEEIIRIEKEKCKSYITLENIDEVIEKALDNPMNLNFTLSVDGTIKWEGKPSLEYEADINRRKAKAKRTQL